MAKKKKVVSKKTDGAKQSFAPATDYGPKGLKFVAKYKDVEASVQITEDGFVTNGKTFENIRDLGEHLIGKRWRDFIRAGIKRALAEPKKDVAEPVAKKVTKVSKKSKAVKKVAKKAKSKKKKK